MKIRIDAILPNPDNPRREFDPDELESLAASIEERGLINPIIVQETWRHEAGAGYIIVDGERRWRACQLLGLPEIEANLRVSDGGNSDRELFLDALVSNVMRSNLNVVEEALRRMMDEHRLTRQEVADLTGLSLGSINNHTQLLRLEESIVRLFAIKALPFDAGVIQALIDLPDIERVRLALHFAQRGTSGAWIMRTCKRYIPADNEANSMIPRPETEKKKLVEPQNPLIGKEDKNPAMREAARKINIPADHYNVLAAAGELPPWERVRTAAEQECRKGCALYEYADDPTCRHCPLPGFFRRLLESLKGEK
jgi:ParB/RepB/Spo0J family partition protein